MVVTVITVHRFTRIKIGCQSKKNKSKSFCVFCKDLGHNRRTHFVVTHAYLHANHFIFGNKAIILKQATNTNYILRDLGKGQTICITISIYIILYTKQNLQVLICHAGIAATTNSNKLCAQKSTSECKCK